MYDTDTGQWHGEDTASGGPLSPGSVAEVLAQTTDWDEAVALLRGRHPHFLADDLRPHWAMRDAPETVRRYQRDLFVVKELGGQPRVCWRDREGAFRHRSVASFEQAERNRKIEIETENAKGELTKRHVPAAKWWLDHASRAEYETATFAPGRRLPSHILNLWEGWPVRWQHGRPSFMMEHLLINVCDNDERVFDWLIKWLADAVQNVDRTPTTALVLAGPQGSGKNVLVELLFELFAPHTQMITQDQQLLGNFNSHLQDKLFVFANEAFFAGSNKQANALKSLVTDKTMVVEPKGVDAFQVRKHFRLIIASNEDHVVKLDLDDRRYCVLRADSGGFNNDPIYFGELIRHWRECGEREMFLSLLMNEPLESWEEHNIPETKSRQQQRAMSLPPAAQDVVQMLADGTAHIERVDHETGEVWLRTPNDWSAAHGRWMREAGAIGRKKVWSQADQKTVSTWHMPDLATARATASRRLGIRPDWQDEDHDPRWHLPDHLVQDLL